jgi:uncharacterized protein YbjQ (UPF0145 family)
MIELWVLLSLTVIGYVCGNIAERRHFRALQRGEMELAAVLAFSERLPPATLEPRDVQLVGGNVVISIDYFKTLAAALRNLFGGRVSALESLLERARREALLRMKAEALALGADMVVNVKLETASITKGARQQVSSVEVYAYGTALIPRATRR